MEATEINHKIHREKNCRTPEGEGTVTIPVSAANRN